jgi:hypothetical protein
VDLTDEHLGSRLLDDAGPGEAAAARWQQHRTSRYADRVGALVVPDTALAAVGRTAASLGTVVEVAVVVSGGAGGLVAAGRAVSGVRLTAAHATLRDLDDLAGNARRVVAAAAELDDVEIGVGLPWAPGWEAAVEEVEAAGLLATVVAGPHLADQLYVLVEADLPYRVLPGLLAATAVLVEEADVERARRVLDTELEAMAVLADWPADGAARIRRRLRGVGVLDVAAAAAALTPRV